MRQEYTLYGTVLYCTVLWLTIIRIQHYFDQICCVSICIRIKGEISREQNWFQHPSSLPPDLSEAATLLQFCILVCLFFHLGCLFCHYLFPILPSFGASGRLFFVIVAFLASLTFLNKGYNLCV